MKKTTLVLIRHGETTTNVKNLLHKFGDPDKLTDKGKKQIELTASKLKELGLEVLYASNEARAFETAEIIGHTCNLEVKVLDGMEERNWGDLSGKPWSEISPILNPMTLEERYNYIPPKGESWKVFEQRLITSVKNAIQANTSKVVGIVTHGGSIRALMPYLLNVSKEESFKYDPRNASISTFEFRDNNITMISVDDVTHLEDLG